MKFSILLSLWLTYLLSTCQALLGTPHSGARSRCPSNTHIVLLSSHFECCAAGESDFLFPTCLSVDSGSIHASDALSSTEASSYPWTHIPSCTEILPKAGDKLCIYSNASFSNGRGISIFTTPSIAGAFLALPPLSSAVPGLNPRTGAWHTAPLEGKGIGMLASMELSRGDIISSNSPLLLVYPEIDLSTAEREEFLKTAVEQMPEESKKAYYELTGIYGDERMRVQDRLKANAFEMQVGGVMHLALFPEASRMNHDCAPNAQYYMSPDMLTQHVHATRPIHDGEEITISYATPFSPTFTRKQNLFETFHFHCKCTRCVSGPESDSNLLRTSDLQQELSTWLAESLAADVTSGNEILQKVEELIELHEEEGLQGFMDEAYGYAAVAYNAVGDADTAVKYAEMALEAVRLRHGPGGESWLMWHAFQEDSTKHWSWKRKV